MKNSDFIKEKERFKSYFEDCKGRDERLLTLVGVFSAKSENVNDKNVKYTASQVYELFKMIKE